MTVPQRLARLRHLAQWLGMLALFLFFTAPLEGAQGEVGGGFSISALVPWAVGIIGVLVLYILKLTREIEKDFTDTKSEHSTQIAELEKGRIRNEGRIDLLSEQIAGIPEKIAASRHQVRNDIAADHMRLEDRVQFVERKLMERQPRSTRQEPRE